MKNEIAASDVGNAVGLDKLKLSDLFAKLGSSPSGLSSEVAEKRLVQYGYNELVEGINLSEWHEYKIIVQAHNFSFFYQIQ